MLAAVLALGGLLSVATAQGPEFDLQKFKETYVRDGLTHPRDNPKHDPTHEDFDPFDIPMPVVAPGVAPEDAFAELDANNDGVIKGEEFAAIPKSDKFNKVTREEMDADYALFGMTKDLFRKRHPELDEDQLHKLFNKHDDDSNDKLFRDEYNRAIRSIKSEV